jgi:hypothetical protein
LNTGTLLKRTLTNPRRTTASIGWVVVGHSEFDDDVWRLLSVLPTTEARASSLAGYDFIEYLGLMVMCGASVRHFDYDNEKAVGYEILVADRAKFIDNLNTILKSQPDKV